MTATVHRLLIKRKHIAALVIAALVFPAAALAASGTGSAGANVAISDAQAVERTPVATSGGFPHLAHQIAQRLHAAQRKAEREAFAELPGGVSIATLESIAACESGGDPTAVSSEGTYRGKYQFDYGTWESVGGHGDPAAAPEYEQDYRAALLYSRSGSSPWPVCG